MTGSLFFESKLSENNSLTGITVSKKQETWVSYSLSEKTSEHFSQDCPNH